jgi:2-succinyl-5-enolpyruvyl-6-hydroxy-3-cyclohexene-1-carboxylate synthase
VNPSTAFGVTFTDELIRCGLTDVVVSPGSRSTPLAMAFADLASAGRVRLHVRIDERAGSYTALGLAKASGRPVAIVCTSGTAAANYHPAVIEADESGVPLIVLTADRPAELRGTGANQTIDQVKLYGSAVRWFTDAGVPEARAGAAGYWRSLACQAWALSSGGFPGPVHLNLPFREPLVPDGSDDWPESLAGRADGEPWTRFGGSAADAPAALPWTERGVVVCGDGSYDADAVLSLARRAGWPVLAEPSSNARRGPNALSAYEYLLASSSFMSAHRPDLVVTAGRPGLTRPQSALLALDGATHVVIAQGPGRWTDPPRKADLVVGAVTLTGVPAGVGASAGPAASAGAAASASAGVAGWLDEWRRADERARHAVDSVLYSEPGVTEPGLARELTRVIPDGSLLWTGNSLPVRDIDEQMPARAGVRVLANRGTSGIDGTISAAAGAALAHDGPAFALIGDLALVHDAAGLAIGPGEPRPDLCLVVVNNDGGGIFSTLEPAAFPATFERVFGTPHGVRAGDLAAAFGVPYQRLDRLSDLPKAIQGTGLRIIEARTDRADGAALRTRLRSTGTAAVLTGRHPPVLPAAAPARCRAGPLPRRARVGRAGRARVGPVYRIYPARLVARDSCGYRDGWVSAVVLSHRCKHPTDHTSHMTG